MANPTSTGSGLADFSVAAADLVHGADGATAYSYAVADPESGDPSLLIDLTGATPTAYTDCNGWVNYALNSVAPLHFAVLSAARDSYQFKMASFDGVGDDGKPKTFAALDESTQPFARAFVLSHSFAAERPVASQPTVTDGFAQVTDFATLEAGDVIAYATGIYSDLDDHALPITTDTGHTMIVTGAAVALGLNADASVASLDAAYPDDPVTNIYAVPIVDSSDVVHMQTGQSGLGVDDRPLNPQEAGYNYLLSKADSADAPSGSGTLYGGGLGTGTLWFATDASGRAIGFRFNEHGSWKPANASGQAPAEGALITAARLQTTIDTSLIDKRTLVDGRLQVTLMPNRAATLGGTTYAVAERLTGTVGLLVNGEGTLTLSSASDFTGGIRLQGVGLNLTAAGAAGSGTIITDPDTSNMISIGAGTATVLGGGNDTVSAAGTGLVVTGGQRLHFIGSGAATVSGGAGSATISGGAGGVYRGGTAGENVIHGAGGSTLIGGGAGDQLFGGAGDTMEAAAGNSTLTGGLNDVLVDADGTLASTGQRATVYGASTGSDVVVGTGGDFTAVGRGGATTLFGGAGTGVTWAGASHLVDVAGTGRGTLVVGTGQSYLWINQAAGAQTVIAVDGASGGSAEILGFRPGTDSFRSAGYAAPDSQAVVRGSLVVTLSDHSTLTFVGVTSLT